MLKCPKCGVDNLLTAIFCRGCGEKLELDELRPESFGPPKLSKTQKMMKLVQKSIGIAFTLLVILVAIGIVMPVPGIINDAEPSQEALKNYEVLLRKSKKSRSVVFTNEEASALINQQIKQFSGDPGVPKPYNISAIFLADGDIQLILSSQLSFLKLHTTLQVTPQVPSPGSVNLQINKARIGMIPLPAALRPKLTDNFKTVVNNTLSKAKGNISKIVASEGSVSISR